MGRQIFDDVELQEEHEALYHMACILAEKWAADLEKAECSYSTGGILSQYDTFWKYDYEAFRTLANGHNRRVKAYQQRKREEKENDERKFEESRND